MKKRLMKLKIIQSNFLFSRKKHKTTKAKKKPHTKSISNPLNMSPDLHLHKRRREQNTRNYSTDERNPINGIEKPIRKTLKKNTLKNSFWICRRRSNALYPIDMNNKRLRATECTTATTIVMTLKVHTTHNRWKNSDCPSRQTDRTSLLTS